MRAHFSVRNGAPARGRSGALELPSTPGAEWHPLSARLASLSKSYSMLAHFCPAPARLSQWLRTHCSSCPCKYYLLSGEFAHRNSACSFQPKVLLATTDDNAKVSHCREGSTRYSKQPAQVIVAELLPDVCA